MRKIILFCSLCCFGSLLDEQPAWSQGPDFNTLETIRIREAFQKAITPKEIAAVTAECAKIVQYFNFKEHNVYMEGLLKGISDNSTVTIGYYSKKLNDIDDSTILAFNRICHP